jgi:hypothetical protein
MSETQEDATSVAHKRPCSLCLGGLLPLKPVKAAFVSPRTLEPDEVMHQVLLLMAHAGQLAAVLHPALLVIHPLGTTSRPSSSHCYAYFDLR